MPDQVEVSRTPVAVFISGRGSNLQSLIDAAADREFPAEIAVVVSDQPDAYGLQRAKDAGIPHASLPRSGYANRRAFETALGEAARSHHAECICLAGFMRILSADFVADWRNLILNIHPSLLPSFKGLDTHARVLDAGVKFHGATVHLVTENLDEGAILAQAAVPVLPADTADSLAARVLAAEHVLYPAALRSFLTGNATPARPTEALFNPSVVTPNVPPPL